MARITIRERTSTADGMEATVAFDGEREFSATIRDPFSPEEEQRLEWYFEEHLRFPFTDTVRARDAGASIRTYGETLFSQVFAHPDALVAYRQALGRGVGSLRFEVVGSPDFQRLHWEALRDPALPHALALDAPMVRRSLAPVAVEARAQESPTLNLLVVTARPDEARDVAYRTITRPLVEGLRAAQVRTRVEILRPGTYRALSDHLEDTTARSGAGFYHVIHFDVHGGLLTYDELQNGAEANRLMYQARYGRSDLARYDGLRAFLFLEGPEDGKPDPVEAEELSGLLAKHQIPVAVLNACESGKQVGATETSLGSRLMQAGVQHVLAMGYSVTVSAAEILVETLYRQLLARADLSEAIRRGRLELHNRKERRAYFNQRIDLEDWLLPVAYESRPRPLPLRDFTPEEAREWYGRQARAYEAPPTTYGFVGRDLDVLRIEKRLLTRRNVLLVRGMGGAGKSTLLHHLMSWWQTTGLVDQVFYFGWDERGWTREQILRAIAERVYSRSDFYVRYDPLPLEAQQKMLADTLRAERHLLVLDNLESITGTHLAIRNTLPPEEREALRRFVADLTGGRSLVLLGSRSEEEWLAPGTFEGNVYDLPGLDAEAASMLADRVLEAHGAARYREDTDFRRLLGLLDGYPLALEVVLANLARQTPAQVVEALQSGGVDFRTGSGESKTEDILLCIDYSHGNLASDAQELLLCLAPFSLVFNPLFAERFVALLREEDALSHLPFDRWAEILDDARHWGLLTPDSTLPILHLQPVFPYFLRTRLSEPKRDATRAAIERAFRELYREIGNGIANFLGSGEPGERQVGQVLVRLEYENLHTALLGAVRAQESFIQSYLALSTYLDTRQDQQRGLVLAQSVREILDEFSLDALSGDFAVEAVGVLDNLAKRLLLLRQYPAAQNTYEKVLGLMEGFAASMPAHGRLLGSVHHQLGVVAQEQRQWEQAEQHYHKALQICVEFKDLYSQASTYHQLGMVAQDQREWEQAEQHYRKALQICVEFKDLYSQAGTYHQLGMVAQEQRQWEQAEQHYRKALQICVEFKDLYPQARIHHQLGVVAQKQRQWKQAEQHYRKALQICVEFKDLYSQASTYHHLGVVAQEQRQWEQAEQHYRKALRICVEFKDLYSQAGTYHQLGRVAQEQREWEQAEQHYRKALQIYVEFKDLYEQAGTYHQLGVVAQEQRQWEQAEQHYRKALRICVEFKDLYSQASTYHQLGVVAQEQRQWEQAEQHYRKALETCVEYNDEHSGSIVLRSLARLWHESGSAATPALVAEMLNCSREEAELLLGRFLPGDAAE